MPKADLTKKRTSGLLGELVDIGNDSEPSPVSGSERQERPNAGETWQERNKRVNIYMNPQRHERYGQVLKETGDSRSLSALVNDLLDEWVVRST